MPAPLSRIEVIAFDIDGTLTDGTTTWLGDDTGWTQTYSTRDGEAILHLVRTGLVVLPLSRNRTKAARIRMEALGLRVDFLGVESKVPAIVELAARLDRPLDRVMYVGDGREDADVFTRVGFACAVRDAHPLALGAAHLVLAAPGGSRVMEEVALRIERARSEVP